MYTPVHGHVQVRSPLHRATEALAPSTDDVARALGQQLARAEAMLRRWETVVRLARPLPWTFDPEEPELMVAGLLSDAEGEHAERLLAALRALAACRCGAAG